MELIWWSVSPLPVGPPCLGSQEYLNIPQEGRTEKTGNTRIRKKRRYDRKYTCDRKYRYVMKEVPKIGRKYRYVYEGSTKDRKEV